MKIPKAVIVLIRFPLMLAALLSLFLLGCQSKIIYFPRPYTTEDLEDIKPPRYERLSWQTDQGSQTGTLALPESGQPQQLWIVCAGNGSLSLDLRDYLENFGPDDVAYFYFDYPSYGSCEGSPNPSRIRASLQQGVPLAIKKLGWDLNQQRAKLRVFGHSLGAACALIAAEEFRVSQGVLLSPFTSLMDMSKEMFRVPLGPLVLHRFDNQKTLSALVASTPEARLQIFHGDRDEVIPVSMAQKLSAAFPNNITLHIVEKGRHNNLTDMAAEPIAKVMKSLR